MEKTCIFCGREYLAENEDSKMCPACVRSMKGEGETCKTCGKVVGLPPCGGNYIVFCPDCRKFITSISDYGFGPIVPCVICLGKEIIGTISEGSEGYILSSKTFGLNITLKGGYRDLAAYQEAEEIIQKYL